MAYITFGSDSVAIEESTQSQPAGWRRTWAKSTAPTAFGGHRVSQSLRMRNGLHSAQEGGEGCPLPSGVHSRAGLQSSQGHRGKGYKEPRAAGRRPAWRGCTSACTGVAAGPQPGSCVPQKKEDKYIHHLQNGQLIRHNSCLFLPSLFYTVAGELFQNFCQIKSDPLP